jgi:homoserine O-acetyltransferase
MGKHLFKYEDNFQLESGAVLKGIDIAYHTYGTFDSLKNNVIWVCHALTANSDVADWWPNMVGENCFYNPDEYFIICANILGSCYGTTGPLSINNETKKPFYQTFPNLTVRDLVKAHDILANHLGINKIHTLIGGSLGGQQAMEWCILNPQLCDNLIVLAANCIASPWNIAFNESQRMAIKADSSFDENKADGGLKGLAAARSIALLSYRNNNTYNLSQAEEDLNKTSNFKASSYQQYQGKKLVNRFNAYSYYLLSQILDSQNVGRNRGGVEKALKQIKAKTLLIGISSDIIFYSSEVEFISNFVPNSTFVEINSLYGHDGFLIEWKTISKEILTFYKTS